MGALDQANGAPILQVLADLFASGVSGLCLPPVLAGILQVIVALRAPARLSDARALTASTAVLCTVLAMGRAAAAPLGVSSPASELVLYAHAFLYGLLPVFLAAVVMAVEASVSLLRRPRTN